MSACADPEDPLRISDQTRSLGLVVSRTQLMQQEHSTASLSKHGTVFTFAHSSYQNVIISGKRRYVEERL